MPPAAYPCAQVGEFTVFTRRSTAGLGQSAGAAITRRLARGGVDIATLTRHPFDLRAAVPAPLS